MSVNYNTAVLNARLQEVADAIDAGGSAGVLRLLDGGGSILSSLPMNFPCGAVAGGVLTFTGMSLIDPSAAGSGSVAAARCEDSTGTTVISGLTVGTTLADIIMSPTNLITAGQVIAITAASITGN